MARRCRTPRASLARCLSRRRRRTAVAGAACRGCAGSAGGSRSPTAPGDENRAVAIRGGDDIRRQPRHVAGRAHRRCDTERRVGHARRIRCRGPAPAAGRSSIREQPDVGSAARRGRRTRAGRGGRLRHRFEHHRPDRGGRLHLIRFRRRLMITDQRMQAGGGLPSLGLLVDNGNHFVQTIASPSVVQLVLRIALAVPFWRSGMLKWAGFLRLNDTAVTLFSDEFMLHLPGGPYHCPAPTVMAFLSGSGEILFPILLILGLGTRFAALGLLCMTVIVELTVPDGWPIHLTWAAMALGIMAYGPGRASLDHVLGKLYGSVE